MGSLLDQLQKKSRVTIHISNPQIQQHQYAKMASFKILLVVALVAFIGSTDALKCMESVEGKEKTCGDDAKSCVIEATIKIANKKGTIVFAKQGCDKKDLAGFVVPAALHDLKEDAELQLPYYCKEDNCNIEKAIKDEIETKEKMTALLVANPKAEIATAGSSGAAQTTVAVATIALSVVMARLAL